MNCYKHPDKDSAENCSLCGEPICEECMVEIAGRPYCKECVNKIVTQSIMEKTAANAPSVEAKAEETAEAAPQKAEKSAPAPVGKRQEGSYSFISGYRDPVTVEDRKSVV